MTQYYARVCFKKDKIFPLLEVFGQRQDKYLARTLQREIEHQITREGN